MRITNSITTQNALRALQRGQREIAAASDRVTTGLRFQRASEDPTAAAQVMRTSGSLRALDQYQRNVDAATARSSAEEGVLDQLTDVLSRARELATSQATATANSQTRLVTKAEVDQLLEFAVSLGNTRTADGYLFGGTMSDQPPFSIDRSVPGTVDFTTTNPSGQQRVEISAGQYLQANHDGTQVFGTAASGVLAALRDLSKGLGANDDVQIQTSLTDLSGAFDSVQVLIGDAGARTNQLQLTSSNLDALGITLTTFKSDLQEVDFEKAVTELVGRQTAFQSAMLATSRVMGMNLTDYLR